MKQKIAKIITFGCLLITLAATQVSAKTFNVTAYGAKGDDKTDNTEAFSKCMDLNLPRPIMLRV